VRALAPVVVLLVLAGCAAPAVDEDPRPLEPRRIELAMSGCDIVELFVPVDAATARPHVPPGFALAESNGRLNVVFGASVCGGVGGRAYIAIPVEPEDPALADPQVARHYWEPEHVLVQGDAFADAMAVLNATTTPGQLEVLAVAPRAGATVRGEGWEHVLASVGGAAPASAPVGIPGVFREWFAAEGGYGYLEAAFGASPVGGFAGTLRAGEGTPTRALVGAETAPLPGVAFHGVALEGAVAGFVPYDASSARAAR